jgi:hypothetical protein
MKNIQTVLCLDKFIVYINDSQYIGPLLNGFKKRRESALEILTIEIEIAR